MPGTNAFAIKARDCQNAALSGVGATFSIAPNRFSTAKTNIPAEKQRVATDRCARQAAAAASAALNIPATNANAVFGLTIRFKLDQSHKPKRLLPQ